MPETIDRALAEAGAEGCWLPRSQQSPRFARRLLRGLLAEVEGGHRFAGAGELLLSELVSNALEHADTPGRLIWVGLEVDVTRLRIEVHDASPVRPVLREVYDDERRGRGLVLVERLSTRWGCCPRAGGIGKIVWCECGHENASGPAAGDAEAGR
ncbi:hypothetical protein GCM10009760_14610 [Kitasatospora kazusensis]|uniref:Histidine kinase/HSP90-like ATPase domain-containing protein n=1 Tax=Kitasatospora kazusensis TaxID=407974 RepID=A0ABN2Z2B0_9ACTN